MDYIAFPLSTLPLTLEAGIVTNTKPFIPKTRNMPCYVLRYVTQGGMTLIEDGKTYELNPGNLVILSANHEHSASEEARPNTSWFFVHFYLPDPQDHTISFKEYLPLSTSTSLTPEQYRYTLSLPKYLYLPPANEIHKKLEHLVTLFSSGDIFHFGYQNALLMEILVDLCRLATLGHTANPEVSNINNLLHYLNDHVQDSFHSDEIANAMNLNYNYLCEIFKKQTGLTIQQYHTSLKMREAERYLRTTEYTISEISLRLGYHDPLYFSNVFKKHHNISPKRYRNLNHCYTSDPEI